MFHANTRQCSSRGIRGCQDRGSSWVQALAALTLPGVIPDTNLAGTPEPSGIPGYEHRPAGQIPPRVQGFRPNRERRGRDSPGAAGDRPAGASPERIPRGPSSKPVAHRQFRKEHRQTRHGTACRPCTAPSACRPVMSSFPAPSHSSSLDHRRRPDTLRTAMATAFF